MTTSSPSPASAGPATCEPSWLAAQRWFGAAHRTIRSLRVVASERLAPALVWQVIEVRFDGAAADRNSDVSAGATSAGGADGASYYQVFWDEAGATDGADRPESIRWLFGDLPVETARLLPGEQSNTSVVIEPGPVIVKVLRRLSAEPNPDAEVVRRLWENGFRCVPEPLGECRRRIDVESLQVAPEADARVAGTDGGSGDGVDLAVARRFLPGSVDGWALALDAGDFTDRAGELGRLTAELHLALAGALGLHRFDGSAAAVGMIEQARRVLGDNAPVGPFERLGRGGVEPAIRVHGDLHLGQMLLNGERWYVLDFEGEPARPVLERIEPASPLRDVAGMLRSFAYAAAVAGHGDGWEQACRTAFLRAYLESPDIGALLPSDPGPILDAFELDKAIYEVAYERANRPDWVAIPDAAVRRLARGSASGS